MTQCDTRNLSMVMDLYEMTMANGYFAGGQATSRAVFDVFYRRNPDGGGFAIFAGLEQVIDQIMGLHFSTEDIAYFRSLGIFDPAFLDYLAGYRFTGDVYAFPEGTIIYPGEPVLTIEAPLVDAQLVETAVLAQINHQSLIATKANRIVKAARGRAVSDFGARRAHNMDAAVYGARAAYVGGVGSTATVLAGQLFGIPVSGTMAHSWVMYYEDEYTAFAEYARRYPDNTVLLMDTYDALRSGVPNAIRVAHEVLEPAGKRLRGIRFDSGDLAYLAKAARAMLDAEGLQDCKIVVSNSLDERTITSLLDQEAPIDSFGVGERLITASSDPIFGAVYKIAAVNKGQGWEPRIKVSETVEKITNPGRKKVYRIYDETGHAVADLLALADEVVDLSAPFRYIDTARPWQNRCFENCTARELQRCYVRAGERTDEPIDLEAARAYVQAQLHDEIWQEEQRFENPHRHFFDMTPSYYEMKMNLLMEWQH